SSGGASSPASAASFAALTSGESGSPSASSVPASGPASSRGGGAPSLYSFDSRYHATKRTTKILITAAAGTASSTPRKPKSALNAISAISTQTGPRPTFEPTMRGVMKSPSSAWITAYTTTTSTGFVQPVQSTNDIASAATSAV